MPATASFNNKIDIVTICSPIYPGAYVETNLNDQSN
jgi:hypothetical protein